MKAVEGEIGHVTTVEGRNIGQNLIPVDAKAQIPGRCVQDHLKIYESPSEINNWSLQEIVRKNREYAQTDFRKRSTFFKKRRDICFCL